MTPTLEQMTPEQLQSLIGQANQQLARQSAPPSPSDPNVILMPGFGDMRARSARIASVHFEERDCHDFFHSRGRSFKLAAGKMGDPSYLTVWDSQQFVPDTAALYTYQAGQPYPGGLPQPVRVELIVLDLLNKWRIGAIGLYARFPLGIMQIAGETATPSEIADMNRAQESHCRAFIDEARRFHRSGEGKITDYHRGCATWMGVENEEWFPLVQAGRMKRSAISGKPIPLEALVDQGVDLMEFYVRHGLDPAEFGDEHVIRLWGRTPKIRENIERRTAQPPAEGIARPSPEKKVNA